MMHPTDMTKNLPSADEILRTIGLQRARNGSDLLGGVAVFGAGILVGAGLALLFAPAAGSEVREQIGSRIDEMRDKATHLGAEKGKSSGRAEEA